MTDSTIDDILADPSESVAVVKYWVHEGFDCAVLLLSRPTPTAFRWSSETIEETGSTVFHTEPLSNANELQPSHYVGYARLPFVESGKHSHVVYGLRQEITYVDEDDWIGFDTSHGGNFNFDADGNWLRGDEYRYHRPYRWNEQEVTFWTPDRVVEEVEQMVDDALDSRRV